MTWNLFAGVSFVIREKEPGASISEYSYFRGFWTYGVWICSREHCDRR